MKLKNILTISIIAAFIYNPLYGQEEKSESKELARSAFDSQLLIDNQSVVIPTKNTLEWDIQHRFGTMENGYDDLYGFYAPSNIRLGFTYSVHERVNLGVGLTKFKHYLDLNAKFLLLKQTKDFSMPISAVYFVNTGIDQRDNELFEKSAHRFTYFHQLIIASRITYKLSLQTGVALSHFNGVDEGLENDMIGVIFGGRYKAGSSSSIIFDFTFPVTSHDGRDSRGVLLVDARPNLSFGYEIATSGHAFQFFISNYAGILPQENLHFNQNSFNKEGILIGFNMTRLWNF